MAAFSPVKKDKCMLYSVELLARFRGMASKTFAIVLDVHGNLEALKTALSVISARKDVDQVIYLGDYFSLGPAPKEVLDIATPVPQRLRCASVL